MVKKTTINEATESNDIKVVARVIRVVRKELDEKNESINKLTRSKAKINIAFDDENEQKENLESINLLIEKNEGLIKNYLEPSLERLYKRLEEL